MANIFFICGLLGVTFVCRKGHLLLITNIHVDTDNKHIIRCLCFNNTVCKRNYCLPCSIVRKITWAREVANL